MSGVRTCLGPCTLCPSTVDPLAGVEGWNYSFLWTIDKDVFSVYRAADRGATMDRRG